MSYSYIVYRGSKEVKNSGSVSVKGFKESVTFKIPLTDYTPGKLKVVIAATNIYGNEVLLDNKDIYNIETDQIYENDFVNLTLTETE